MSVFGICMVRDAVDTIGPLISHMLEEVDDIIVFDNLSTDGTTEILESFGSSIVFGHDINPAYRQSEKMTRLARIAENLGAEYVVPFDADEWWHSPHGRIADVIKEAGYRINVAPIYDYVPTGVDNPEEPDPFKRICYRRKKQTPLHKVACKTGGGLVIAMGNHNASYFDEMTTTWDGHDLIDVRHFPYRTAEQFVNKAVTGNMALELTDLPFEMGQHWRQYAKIYEDHGQEALEEVFWQWFHSQEIDDSLIYDPVGEL